MKGNPNFAQIVAKRVKRLFILVIFLSALCSIKPCIIAIIVFYQHNLSGLLPMIKCRYKISCSEFTKKEIEKNGVLIGTVNALKRINNCW